MDLNKPPFEVLSLKVDSKLQILICLACRHALKPTTEAIVYHFKTTHLRKRETIERFYPGLAKRLDEALKQFSFAVPEEVRAQPHDRAPVLGIKVEKGFYCPLVKDDGKQCLYTSGEKSTMETHIKKTHQGHKDRPSLKTIEDYPCDYQTLFTGKLKRFYRVQTGYMGFNDSDHRKNPYLAFVQQKDPTSGLNHPPEHLKSNELPSFLRVTRWHIFLEPYRSNPKGVTTLIQYPVQCSRSPHLANHVEEVLCKLKGVTNAWMGKVHNYWKSSGDYVHRILAQYPM